MIVFLRVSCVCINALIFVVSCFLSQTRILFVFQIGLFTRQISAQGICDLSQIQVAWVLWWRKVLFRPSLDHHPPLLCLPSSNAFLGFRCCNYLAEC